MQFYQEKGLAACGLACPICRESGCLGCAAKGCEDADTCGIYACVQEKDIAGCWQCEAFPCDQGMFASLRLRAFVRYARLFGVERLLERLRINQEAGIVYHRADGLQGDYDALGSEAEVMHMIEYGREGDPYANCPVLQTEHFTLRLVEETDARDLLSCYADPASRTLMNEDYCLGGFNFDTEAQMLDCLRIWRQVYETRDFIRWAIVDKETNCAVGTIEMFGGEMGVFRLDVASRFEKEPYLSELTGLTNTFHLLFATERIVTKVPHHAQARRAAFAALGYHQAQIEGREHYLVHQL